MSYTTARLALPLPDGNDGPSGPDVPYWFGRLGTRLEATVVSFEQGFLSARPRAGQAGRVYFAADTGVLFFDDGTSWRATTGTGAVQVVGAAGAPGFNTGWTSPQSTRPARFWKEGTRVWLAGLATGGTNGTIFTLPEGYRPRYEQQFAAPPMIANVSIWNWTWNGLYVGVRATTGQVTVSATTVFAGVQVLLDGLSFDLER